MTPRPDLRRISPRRVARSLATMVAGVVLSAVFLMTTSGCQTNEATGRSQLILMPLDQEVALGVEAKPQLVQQYGGEVRDPVLRDYVTSIGTRMAADTEAYNPDLPWTFTFLDSDVINAFALPGGQVFVTRGLAERLTDEAQLAGVIGHEIGHVTARHGGERISDTMMAQLGIQIVGAWAGDQESEWVSQGLPLVVSAAGQGFLLKFGRDQELEADGLGIRYMARQGYAPAALIDVMQTLKAASGGGGQPEFLSTHPHPDTRISRIRRELEGDYAHTVGSPEFGRFESRYRDRMLNRIALLRERGEIGSVEFAGLSTSRWCAHCAGE